MSLVKFKMGAQQDTDDDSEKNIRVVSLYTATQPELPAGWGWLDLLARFCDFKADDFSEFKDEWEEKVDNFAASPSDLTQYKTIVGLLTHNEYWEPNLADNLPASIKYGIYDLCLDFDISDDVSEVHETELKKLYDQDTSLDLSFFCQQIKMNFFTSNSDVDIQEISYWTGNAKRFRDACLKHLTTYKECAKYRAVREVRSNIADENTERVSNAIASTYYDGSNTLKSFINYPRLLKALHDNHFLFAQTRHEVEKLLDHTDHYEVNNERIQMQLHIAMSYDLEHLEHNLLESYIYCAKSDLRILLAMNLACHFVTTAALALVEDQRHVWGQNRVWSKTHVPDARMKHFSEMSRTILEIQQLLGIEHIERKDSDDDDLIRHNIKLQINNYIERAALTTDCETKIGQLEAEILMLRHKLDKKKEIFLKKAKEYDESQSYPIPSKKTLKKDQLE